MDTTRLQQLRQEISDVSHQILSLLSRRGSLVLEVWEVKKRLGMKLRDPVRERQLLDELVSSNPGPFSDEAIEAIFRRLFEANRDLMNENTR